MTIDSERGIQDAYQGTKVANDYFRVRFESELNRLLHQRQLQAVQRVFDQHKPAKALEVAPGPGRLTRHVKPSQALVCLEYNEGMIAEGKACCPSQVEWVQGNAFELPFQQEFDFIYTFRFVRHFHRDDRERLYTQFKNVLKPGGWLVLDAVNEVISKPLRDANPAGYPVYDKLYKDEQELRRELESAGFEVKSLQAVQRCYPWQYKAQVIFGPRSRLLTRMAIQTLEFFSRGQPLEWIATCRRV